MIADPAGSRREYSGRSLYVGEWRIDLGVLSDVPRVAPGVVLARAVARAVAAAGAPARAAIGLRLADDHELAELNGRHLGQTGPTDVLSFPTLPPSAFPAHPGRVVPARRRGAEVGFALPAGRRIELGDIVVSVERAVAQAAEGRGGQESDRTWDARAELLLLVTHGALHLCGWDHAEPREMAAMRALEVRLLTEGGVIRP